MSRKDLNHEAQILIQRLAPYATQYEGFYCIGRGQFAHVLGAGVKGSEQQVALKILLEQWIDDDDIVKRLVQNEREACRRVGLLVAAIDLPELQPPIYGNVIKYLEGVPLREFVEGDHSTLERLEVFLSLCQTTAAIHQKGIVHRDLAPQNIMVNGFDAVVIDFGNAKLMDQRDFRTQTIQDSTGKPVIICTAQFAAPEVLQSLLLGTFRSDVFSLGLLGYYILTAQAPYNLGFDPKSVRDFELARSIVRDGLHSMESLTTCNPEITLRLEQIITECLHFEPNQRFESAEQVMEALRKAQDGGNLIAQEFSGKATTKQQKACEAPAKQGLIFVGSDTRGRQFKGTLQNFPATLGFGDGVDVDLSRLADNQEKTGPVLEIIKVNRKFVIHALAGQARPCKTTINGVLMSAAQKRYLSSNSSVVVDDEITLRFIAPWSDKELHDSTSECVN